MVLRRRLLGKTGLSVTEMGFGGIPIQKVSEDVAIEVVRRCHELGINYYDTARGYTTSEERIGKALEGHRGEVYIATKTQQKTADGLRKELEISLRNLRTDYVDLYQLHNVTADGWKTISAPGGALEAILEAKRTGKALHIGVTSHSPSFLTELIGRDNPFETVMVGYNYIATEPADRLLPLCREKNVGTIIMKPFGGGAFTDSRTALKYVLSNNDVSCAIPGMLSVSEVDENVSVCQGELSLSESEKYSIEKDRNILGKEFCAACNYCQPCPAGIPIDFVLRTENSTLRRMGWTEGVIRQTKEAAPKVDACLLCGACETRCPYQLPIRELLPVKMASLLKRLEERSVP